MAKKYTVFGEAAWLYSFSPLHKRWAIDELQRWLLPPIIHEQYRLFEMDGAPVGWLSWAWLGDEEQQKYLESPGSLDPKEWRSGANLWAVDFCAPFGHLPQIRRQIRAEFKGYKANFLRVKPGSDTAVLSALVDRHNL